MARRDAGFALLELSVAMLIATLLLVWGTSSLMQGAQDARSQAAGVWLLTLRKAVSGMMERHFQDIAMARSPRAEDGRLLYVNAFAPTVAELKADGLLAAGFPEQGPAGAASLRLWRSGQCPDGGDCRIEGLAYLNTPWQYDDGAADTMRLAVLVQALAGHGGQATQTRVRGPAFDFSNPLPDGAALPVGTPVAWAGLDAATADRYVRRRDTRDPELQGGLSVAGAVSAAGDLRVGAALDLAGQAAAGAACARAGLVSRAANGSLLSCVNGIWSGSDGGFGGAYAINTRRGCRGPDPEHVTANPRTGACRCPNGYQAILISAGSEWSEAGHSTYGFICMR